MIEISIENNLRPDYIMNNLRKSNNFYQFVKLNNILFIICVTFISYQTFHLFNEFMTGNTVTTISIGTIRNTTLAAISICINGFNLKKLSMSNENISKFYEHYWASIPSLYPSTINILGQKACLQRNFSTK